LFLLIFWFLLLLEMNVTYLDCAAKLVLFSVGLSSARR
jgi:hypothetical protein